MERQDWSSVTDAIGSEEKAALFQDIIDREMDAHFPLCKARRRKRDLPWLDSVAKKKIKKKKAVYKDEGKSPRFIKVCENLERYLQLRQESYLENQRAKLLGPDASKQFHKNVRNFHTADRPKQFNVADLMPDKSEKEVADQAADFFSEISREFDPLLPHQIPESYERVLPRLTVDEVAQQLVNQKKPGSMVRGDILPKLINSIAKFIAIPLTSIYNEIVRTKTWPKKLKIEHVTLIPKKHAPSSFADLRNISCTSFFSKCFETFVLKWVMEEVSLKNNQYGGVKGCSTNHMLLEIWQKICNNAEDYRTATVLTAIDYSKAFNRLSFQECLASFKAKGASTTVMQLLATFLSDRVMSVRVGDKWSEERKVFGGCPQGSILGVYLFNVTTDDLEDDFVKFDSENISLANQNPVEILPNVRNVPDYLQVPPVDQPVGTQSLKFTPTVIYKYVDDNIICECLNLGQIDITTLNDLFIKRRRALSSQNAFRSMVRNAVKKGMKVNASKTCVLAISDSLSYVPKTFIENEEGEIIESSDSLKVLGFNFTNRPSVQAQVDSIIKKFKQRYWTLRHLRRVGFNSEELVRVYKSNILPIADYTDVIYHSLMTDEMDEKLENAQNSALRCIFDHRLSARRLREMSGLTTLRQRRIAHVDKFAKKNAASSKFGHLFPLKQGRTSSRTGEEYVEQFARCDRLKNSPLFFMRRRLNGKEGKKYGERNRVFREA